MYILSSVKIGQHLKSVTILECTVMWVQMSMTSFILQTVSRNRYSIYFHFDQAGLPLLWNLREKWLLFQVLTKEKWETTGRSGESIGRSQNISLINCTTFHIRWALSWHSYVIMYFLCIKVYSVVVKFLVFVSISSLWFTYHDMSLYLFFVCLY